MRGDHRAQSARVLRSSTEDIKRRLLGTVLKGIASESLEHDEEESNAAIATMISTPDKYLKVDAKQFDKAVMKNMAYLKKTLGQLPDLRDEEKDDLIQSLNKLQRVFPEDNMGAIESAKKMMYRQSSSARSESRG